MFKNWPNKKSFILPTIFALILFALPFSYAPDVLLGSTEHINTISAAGEQTDPSVAENMSVISSLLYSTLKNIGAFFAWVGGYLFDISLSWFVFSMKDTAEHLGLVDVISTVWVLVRDLFNLLFIFGLLFIGFKIILGVDESSSRRTLGLIVVAALLINFSLYASQVVVDFGNFTAAEIATLFDIPEEATGEVLGIKVYHLSNSFAAATDIDKIADAAFSHTSELQKGVIDIPDKGIGIGESLILGLVICLLLMVLGFVFAAGAIMMFTRFMYLLFLMMFSPFMFLGLVLPNLMNVTKNWWHTLIYQSLVGPAYLFTLYVSLLALTSMIDKTSLQGDTGLMGLIMLSLIVAAFAMGSLIVARKMGTIGATQAIGIGKGIGRWARSRARGVSGFATGKFGRNTLGLLGDNWNRGLEKKGVSDKSMRRSIASSLGRAKYGGSYSRVDARSSKEKADVKKARYGQVKKVNKAITTGHAADKGSSERIAMERAITGATNEQVIEMLGQHEAGSPEYENIIKNMSASQYNAVLKAKPEELDDAAKNKIAGKRKASVKEKIGSDLKTATDAQLKVLGASEIEEHAADLKQSQFDAIMKSDDYAETEKTNIKAARESQQKDAFNEDPESFLSPMKGKDIAKLPKDILKDPKAIPHLTSDALSSIVDEQSLAPEERRQIAMSIAADDNKETNKDALDFLRNNPKGRQFAAGADIPSGNNKEESGSKTRADAEEEFKKVWNPPNAT